MDDPTTAIGSSPPSNAKMQDELIARGLAEVYLLFDNVSSVHAKTLPTLLNEDPLFKDGDASWIEQIFRIGWPPENAVAPDKAHMAAQLVVAKDALNAAAAPATGASIAFTTLTTETPWWPWRKSEDTGKETRGDTWPPSRSAMAHVAFPVLAGSAEFSALLRRALLSFLILWLLLTCVLSWDVATGSALVNRIHDLQKQGANEALAQGLVPASSPTATPTQVAANESAPTSVADAVKVSSNTPPVVNRVQDAGEAKISDASYGVAAVNLRQWLEPGDWESWFLPRSYFRYWMGGGRETSVVLPQDAKNGAKLVINGEWAAIFVNILAGTILPICYGVLGAGAAVMRGISTKIRDYLLMPRDLRLAGIQLALGAVIGACISLFINSDGASADNGLIGQVHLSQSALCFVAGYGVEGVFQALDELVRRVFNLDRDKMPVTSQT